MSLWFVRLCAALIIFRAFTNFAKLFQGEEATLVFFGRILHGSDTTFLAAAVGLFMLVAGVALLIGARWALPLVAIYAAYVMTNLLAWTITNPDEFEKVGRRLIESSDPSTLRWVGIAGFLGYCIVALATTAGPAWILYRRRGGGA
jgi:hypothetical protein